MASSDLREATREDNVPEVAGSHTDYLKEHHVLNLGLSLHDLFKLGLKFFKEKEGTKALQLSYNDRIKLTGLIKQANHGKFLPEISADVGLLDVMGNDRNQYWLSLGDMSAEDAVKGFLALLMEHCPQFLPYLEAHKVGMHDLEQNIGNENVMDDKNYEVLLKIEEKRLKQLKLKKQIKDCLNQQTSIQYRQYAKQQMPDNEEEQEALISQLQEQHFEQYIDQVHSQQLIHQRQQYFQLRLMVRGDTEDDPLLHENKNSFVELVDDGNTKSEVSDDNSEANHIDSNELPLINEDLMEFGMPQLIPASLWTRSDIKEFKNSVRKNPDNIIKVGSLSTATVKVPTHENGTSIFWEFATDNYDIGFGVYFEWTLTPPEDVTVQASESSGEEDVDEDGEPLADKGDIEKGNHRREPGPPMDEIIQIYRRDCHEEVYCGSHTYPGRGVYHLKFDNSYSLWRSKTVYYKVFYSQ